MSASARPLGNVDGPNVRDWLNEMVAMLQSRGGAYNLMLKFTVASNALTIAAKQQGDTNADADNPIVVGMRSTTGGSGDFNVRSIVAALSLVVSSGSTLGHGNADGRWTYVYLIDNAGTLELAVSSKFFNWQGFVTTVAEGGGGAADSASTMYSATARTGVPYLCVGKFIAPQTTAGTWATAPSSAQVAPFETPRASQSGFMALAGTVANVTGDGTVYTIVYASEVYDNNGELVHTTGIFTALEKGQYVFCIETCLDDIAAGHNVLDIRINSSNHTHYLDWLNPGAVALASGEYFSARMVTVDMDAGDVCFASVMVNGSTPTVTLTNSTKFSGFLAYQ